MYSVADYDQRSVEAFASLNLTPREAEVLFWISQGKSNRDIAVIVGAKTGTVCKHVEHIFSKLNVENRTSAAVVALEACRSVAPLGASERNRGQAWTAIVGLVAMQFAGFWSGACDIYDALPALLA
jgi:DNA-binding CsgD family transcriptional regulator